MCVYGLDGKCTLVTDPGTTSVKRLHSDLSLGH